MESTGKKAIKEGIEEADYAYYALRQYGIYPSQWVNMEMPERMFICGAIDLELEQRKKAMEE